MDKIEQKDYRIMCTIMTITKQQYLQHTQEILSQIKKDYASNPHGCALILSGRDKLSLQCLSLTPILAMLDEANWDRCWLHLRYSTTATTGLAGCHNFHSHAGWYVQHNGMLQMPIADTLPVDSMAILKLLDIMEPSDAANWLAINEPFCNAFLVNPEEKLWYVTRGTGGSLHTDKLRSCYSTHPIPALGCTIPVEKQTWQEHDDYVPVADKRSTFGSRSAVSDYLPHWGNVK